MNSFGVRFSRADISLTSAADALPSSAQVHPLNLFGLLVNSFGIGWYAFEKFMEGKRKSAALPLYTQLGQNGQETLSLHRDGSQVSRSAGLVDCCREGALGSVFLYRA